MTSITIHLTDDLGRLVDQRAKQHGSSSAEEYVRDLVETDARPQERTDEAPLLQRRLDRMHAGEAGIDAKATVRALAQREGIELPS